MTISTTSTNQNHDTVPPPPQPTRREFITRGAGFLAWTSIGGAGAGAIDALFASSAGALQASGGTDDEYRALVCVFLAGGNDSFNMLLPLNDTGAPHPDYTGARGPIALNQTECTPLTLNMTEEELADVNPEYRHFGIHAGLPFLGQEFNAGRAAFLANVGNLGTYNGSLTSKKPSSLYSHNSQIDQWQTAGGDTQQRSGWVGRLGDRFSYQGNNATVALQDNPFTFLSLAGNNVLQLGTSAQNFVGSENFVASPMGALQLTPPNTGSASSWSFPEAGEFGDLNTFQQLYLQTLKKSLANGTTYQDAWSNAAAAGSHTANDGLGPVAQTLVGVANHMETSRAESVGAPVRQVFFVIDGGYDHHGSVKRNQATKFRHLNEGLTAFWDSCNKSELDDNVVLFSCSEFGRTMADSNGGSDHGWGGNSFVMGATKNLAQGQAAGGGRIRGKYPKIARSGAGYDVGNRGRVIPTTSLEEYFAELALWMGVKNIEDLQATLPDLSLRWLPTPNVTAPLPLGFLSPTAINNGAAMTLGGDNLTVRGAGESVEVPPASSIVDLLAPGISSVAMPNLTQVDSDPLSGTGNSFGAVGGFDVKLNRPFDLNGFSHIELTATVPNSRGSTLHVKDNANVWRRISTTTSFNGDNSMTIRGSIEGVSPIVLVSYRARLESGQIYVLHSLRLS